MRIGIDGRELGAAGVTGIGRMVALAVHGLRAAGDEVVVYAGAGGPWWDQVTLPRRLARDQIDVFWSPYYKLPLRAPCPAAHTIHDLIPVRFGGPHHRALFGTACRVYARAAALTLTDSHFSRDCLVAELGLSPARIAVIPLAVAPRFAPVPREERKPVLDRLGLAEGHVFTVTNYQPHKNVPRLLAAHRRLPAAVRRAHPLVIAGDGRHGARLATGPDTVRLGRVADDDLPALYASAAVFVFPSLEEGFGLPVLEAMACGAPVVCAQAGALPEVVADAARLVDPRDETALAAALAGVLADEQAAAALRERGWQRAAVFTPAALAGRLRDELQRLAADGKPR